MACCTDLPHTNLPSMYNDNLNAVIQLDLPSFFSADSQKSSIDISGSKFSPPVAVEHFEQTGSCHCLVGAMICLSELSFQNNTGMKGLR